MKPLTPKGLQALITFIDQSYDGNLHAVNRYLSKAIYMLHHLPEDEFEAKEKQAVCYLLNAMREQFYQITSKKR